MVMPSLTKPLGEQRVSWKNFFKELYNTGKFPEGASSDQEFIGMPVGLALKYGKDFVSTLKSQMYQKEADLDPEKMTQLAMYALGGSAPGAAEVATDANAVGLLKPMGFASGIKTLSLVNTQKKGKLLNLLKEFLNTDQKNLYTLDRIRWDEPLRGEGTTAQHQFEITDFEGSNADRIRSAANRIISFDLSKNNPDVARDWWHELTHNRQVVKNPEMVGLNTELRQTLDPQTYYWKASPMENHARVVSTASYYPRVERNNRFNEFYNQLLLGSINQASKFTTPEVVQPAWSEAIKYLRGEGLDRAYTDLIKENQMKEIFK
jgi:hypothetical protein